MRLFVAVEMNPSVEEAAREVIDDLRAACDTTGAACAHHLGRARSPPRDGAIHRRSRRGESSGDSVGAGADHRRAGIRPHRRRRRRVSAEGCAARVLGGVDRWARRPARGGARRLAAPGDARARGGSAVCAASDAGARRKSQLASLVPRCSKAWPPGDSARCTWTRLHCSRAGCRRKGRPTCLCSGRSAAQIGLVRCAGPLQSRT